MDLFLDTGAGGTTTGALFAQLRDAIETGRLAEGDRLPPSRQVAADLGVSRHTVTTVYGRLAGEGYIVGRAGAGSYVSATRSSAKQSAARPAALGAAIETDPWAPEPAGAAPTFDLRSGTPDLGLFPMVEWRRCVTTALQSRPVGYDHPAGSEPLRRTLAHWIGISRAVDTSPDHLIVTSGAQHGIDLVTRLLVRPGKAVAVENPGYPPVTRLFRALGVDVRPVPVDDEGIVVDQIPTEVLAVYTTPSHQSPTGVTMSLQRRRELLAFAEEHDVAIIEDDYDSEYRHVDRPLEPLFRLDRSGRVIYVGTFSKTLAPSLRLGFVVLPESLAQPATNLRALIDRQPPAVTQDALLHFVVDGHLRRHLRRTGKIYSERHCIVTDFTHQLASAGRALEPSASNAGLHVSVRLPAIFDERTVRNSAREVGVAIGNYAECWMRPDPPPGLILGFGNIATTDLPTALSRLEHVVSRHCGY